MPSWSAFLEGASALAVWVLLVPLVLLSFSGGPFCSWSLDWPLVLGLWLLWTCARPFLLSPTLGTFDLLTAWTSPPHLTPAGSGPTCVSENDKLRQAPCVDLGDPELDVADESWWGTGEAERLDEVRNRDSVGNLCKAALLFQGHLQISYTHQ